MDTKLSNSQAGRPEKFWKNPDFIIDYTWARVQPQFWQSISNEPQAAKSFEATTESLVYAYLTVNLNFKKIPLKGFMDDIEENILRACLRLTHGNQKNAAAVLHLKPTTLFEKMRKLCINGRRIKLSGKLEGEPRWENQ